VNTLPQIFFIAGQEGVATCHARHNCSTDNDASLKSVNESIALGSILTAAAATVLVFSHSRGAPVSSRLKRFSTPQFG
jgi:hypothetical protein